VAQAKARGADSVAEIEGATKMYSAAELKGLMAEAGFAGITNVGNNSSAIVLSAAIHK
jgi:hypothetical protein